MFKILDACDVNRRPRPRHEAPVLRANPRPAGGYGAPRPGPIRAESAPRAGATARLLESNGAPAFRRARAGRARKSLARFMAEHVAVDGGHQRRVLSAPWRDSGDPVPEGVPARVGGDARLLADHDRGHIRDLRASIQRLDARRVASRRNEPAWHQQLQRHL
jgi:hypothetical protein